MDLSEFFALNRPLVLFIYGQVFFTLGLAIFIQSRRTSRLKLARHLRWLAGFGVLHGLHEWGLLFIPIQAEYLNTFGINVYQGLQVLLLAASFASLYVFGVQAADGAEQSLRRIAYTVFPIAWTLVTISTAFNAVDFESWLATLSIWTRYLVGFPAAVLSAYSLYQLAHTEVIISSGQRIYRKLQIAGFALLAYAIFGGIFVPSADFFPANLINQTLIEQWLGVPVEILRSLAGLFLTVSMIQALEIFDIEVDRLIEHMEVETIQAAERVRIGQEIHDGVMQSVYSASLIIRSLEKHCQHEPQESPFQMRLLQAQQTLDRAIVDLRQYMHSLRRRLPDRTLRENLLHLIEEPRFTSLIEISLEIDDAIELSRNEIEHLYALVQEALSNAVRHANARKVSIKLETTNEKWILNVADDGQGFDPSSVSRGYGLTAMEEHAKLLDGKITIHSTRLQGTEVRVVSNGRRV